MEIILSSEKKLATVTASKLTVLRIIDNIKKKTIQVIIKELGRRNRITLWSDEQYKTNWTHDDIKNRVIELYDTQ